MKLSAETVCGNEITGLQTFIKLGTHLVGCAGIRVTDEVRSSDVEGIVGTNGFNNRVVTEEWLQRIAHFCSSVLSFELNIVAAATGKFHTIVITMENRANTQQEYDTGDYISDLTGFNELEVGLAEDRLGKCREIVEVTLALGPHIGNQAGNKNTAEQGKQETDDLCGAKPFTGPRPKMKRITAVSNWVM